MSNRGLLAVLVALLLGLGALLSDVQHGLVPVGTAPLEQAERPGLGPGRPWLIALHGLGDAPEDFLRSLMHLDERVRVVSLGAPSEWRGMRSWFPMDSERKAARGIERSALRVAAYAKAHAQTPGQCEKPVVTGFSQGGVLSFALAAHHAELFASAVPVAGRLYGSLLRDVEPLGIRVHALHGAEDDRIDTAAGRRAAEALERAGARVRFETFDGIGHQLGGTLYRRWIEVLGQHLRASCPAPGDD